MCSLLFYQLRSFNEGLLQEPETPQSGRRSTCVNIQLQNGVMWMMQPP